MADEQSNMQKPGQVDVMKITIQSSGSIVPTDISAVWTEISIYEDMSLNHIMGEITVVDSLNLIETLPIIGNERVDVEFRTKSYQGSSYKMLGYVHGIENLITVRPGMQTYTIRFLSPEYVADLQMKISKSYSYMNISDMAYNIYSGWPSPKESLYSIRNRPFYVSPSINATSLIVPNISPMTTLNWLAARAIATNYSGGAHYLFFENQQGFHFKTVEELVDKEKNPDNTLTHYKYSHVKTGTREDMQDKFEAIIEYNRSDECSNTLKDISEGMYSSRLITHDLVTRTVGDSPYSYFKNYSMMSHMEGNEEKTKISNNPSFGGHYDSHSVLSPKHTMMYGPTYSGSGAENWLLQRRSQIAQFGKIKTEVKISGDSKRMVGDVIKVSLPSVGVSTLREKEGQKDKYLSGRYLVTQLCHNIKRGEGGIDQEYSTDMVLSSDSYASEIPKKVPFSWGGSSDYGQSAQGIA